ncbi:N-acetylmuramoyl-L-alanine amidase [Candidatus Peregrinibacteria bacterium]|nr:N-acetylmuramoyl-L-alanine amidase [Candidatus Peregrinibacteria bacterium]
MKNLNCRKTAEISCSFIFQEKPPPPETARANREELKCETKTACQLLVLKSQVDCKKIDEAEKAVKSAIKSIKESLLKRLEERLKKKERITSQLREGIKILRQLLKDKNAARYFAVMNKESRLDNNAKSPSGAIGYFQLIPANVMPDISKYFDVKLTPEELQNPIYNCAVGILYLNLLDHHYIEKNPLFEKLPKIDKEFLAHAMYNAGPTLIKDLWKELKPDSYADFEKRLSDILVKNIGTDQEKPLEQNDTAYGVKYLQYPGVDKYLEFSKTKNSKLNKKIQIGKRRLSIRKLGEILRYCRAIEAIQKCRKIKEVPGEQFILRKEKYTEQKRLWSMAEDLRKELVQKKSKGINEGKTYEERMVDRDFLIMALERLNKEYNPAFPKQNGDSNNIPIGTDIFIPNLAYLAMIKGEFQREDTVNEEKVEIEKVEQEAETPPTKIPLYKNPELEQFGNQILKNKYKLNLEKIEQGINFSKKCKKKRKATRYIILHSTEAESEDRGFESTTRDRRAHYVVSRDGKIVVARDPEDDFDNAGRWQNSRAKALWNGDLDVSARSIGIEVSTNPGEEWSSEQYEAVKKLIHALGEKYKLQAKNILTHSQVACSRYGRGRKQDPMNLNWEKLDLPNNYLLVDRDVLYGRVQSNLEYIERDFAATDQQRENMIAGLRYSVALRKQYSEPLSKARELTEAEWKKQMEKRGFFMYTVKKGDTLYDIARKRKFRTSADAIKVFNSLSSIDLQPGQKLKIPKRQR